MPRLFGKDYEWDYVDGKLCLRKPWILEMPAMKPFTYGDLVEGLRRIEAEGGVAYAGPESEGRIPLGRLGYGLSDPEAGGDAGRSGARVTGAERDSLARQEGHGEEGTGGEAQPVLGTSSRTCTSCWFDSHGSCAGPRHCACWVCYEEEAQDARQRDGR